MIANAVNKIARRGFDGFYTLSIMIISLVFLIDVLSISGKPGINTNYVVLVAGGNLLVFLISLIASLEYVFVKWKKDKYTNLFFIADDDESKARVFSSPILRFGIIFLWIAFVLFFLGTSKTQVWPVPQMASTDAFDMSSNEYAWRISAPVGMAEDGAMFALTTILIFAFWLIPYWITKGKLDLKKSWVTFTILILIASLITSVGLGIFLKGFGPAHEGTYQSCEACYVSAIFFNAGQQFVYQTTGLFFPLAHIAHNYLYAIGMLIAFSIGSVAVNSGFVGLMSKKFFRRWI